MTGRLADKVCIITGVGSGMGQKAVEFFCKEGALVVGCDVDREAAEKTGEAARAAGGQAVIAPIGDLTDPARCRELVAFAESSFGGVDVLYNNAARAHFAFMDEMEPAVWDRCIRDELDIAFYMCIAAWPALRTRGGGSIINVGSLAAQRASWTVGNVAHMAAKAGVIAMTKQMALEGGRHQIRVNSISPGPISTAATKFVLETEEYYRIAGDFLVLGRVGQPADIAHYAVFLASDESTFITGTDLLIDGGHAVL